MKTSRHRRSPGFPRTGKPWNSIQSEKPSNANWSFESKPQKSYSRRLEETLSKHGTLWIRSPRCVQIRHNLLKMTPCKSTNLLTVTLLMAQRRCGLCELYRIWRSICFCFLLCGLGINFRKNRNLLD